MQFLANLLGLIIPVVPIICINLLFFPHSFISQHILAVFPNPNPETIIGLFICSVIVLILKFVFKLIKIFLVGVMLIGLLALYQVVVG